MNLLETFENAVMGWGSNESYHFGLYLKRDLQKFYGTPVWQSVDLKTQQE